MLDRLETNHDTPSTDPMPASSGRRLEAEFSMTSVDRPIANSVEENTLFNA